MIDVPDDFRSFLRSEEMRARDKALDEARATAIKAYHGDKYGDEEEGRSQAVTRDVSEVVDQMLVGILGTLTASGKAVEFDTEPEEIETGEQEEDGQPATRKVDYGSEATAAVHYVFMRKQKGYRILHDAGKAGMLEKTGIVKTYPRQRYKVETAIVPRLHVDEAVEQDGFVSVEPVEDAGFDEALADGLVTEMERPHKLVMRAPLPPEVIDENIPNEWFMIAPDTVEIDEAIYVGDRTPVTISSLVAMGHDYERLKTIWGAANDDTVVQQARDADRSNSRNSVGRRTDTQRQLWLCQEYPLYDLNGDGIAERLFVQRVGMHVLSVTEVEEQPYSGWTPIPMQHRFTGQSMFDKVGFIQRIRTVLLRQGLDSIYLSTAPRTAISEDAIGENTLDDLLTVRAGAIIRFKGQLPPQPYGSTADTSQVSFTAMEMMSSEREAITGVTRQSQGMNPDTTNKTFGGMSMLQQNADQIELYVTRNMAEMLVAPMFGKRYRLMRQYLQPFKMKIEGKYTIVDPSKWPEEPDMNINVGLGTGNKDQRLAHRRELMTYQAEAMGAGLRIVTEQEAYNSLRGFVEDTGLGVPTDYVKDPSELDPVPERPDPEMAKNQATALIDAEKEKNAHEQAMSRIQLAAQESEARLTIEQQKGELQMQLQRDKAAEEAQLANQRFVLETSLAERRFAFEQEMAREKAKATIPDGPDLPSYRPGGALDA